MNRRARTERRPRRIAGYRSPRGRKRGGLTAFLDNVTTARTYLAFLVALGAGLVFIVPTIWATSLTGSLDEAAMVLAIRDPVSLATSALPTLIPSAFAGLVVGSLVLGLSATPLRRAPEMEQASTKALFGVAAIAVGLSLVLVLAGWIVPWTPARAAAGFAQLGVLPPLWAAVKVLTARRGTGDVWKVLAIGWPLILTLELVGEGLHPLPSARISIDEAEPVVGFTLERSEEVTLLVPDTARGPRRSDKFDVITVDRDGVSVTVCDISMWAVGDRC